MKRKWKKQLIIILACIVLIGIYAISVNYYMKFSVKDRIVSEINEGDVDCVLVLGAGVKKDGTPSLLLRERLELSIKLYQTNAAPKILMSGDQGRAGYDEVNKMKEFAVEQGVPSQDIFMDHAGFSTYESMYRARDIFQAKKVIIVTQKYHLYRALYIAEKLGLDAYGVAADQVQYKGSLYREFREIIARNKDFLKTIIQPKPTYLGEVIPVNGDGNATNDK